MCEIQTAKKHYCPEINCSLDRKRYMSTLAIASSPSDYVLTLSTGNILLNAIINLESKRLSSVRKNFCKRFPSSLLSNF